MPGTERLTYGFAEGLEPLDWIIVLHAGCHAFTDGVGTHATMHQAAAHDSAADHFAGRALDEGIGESKGLEVAQHSDGVWLMGKKESRETTGRHIAGLWFISSVLSPAAGASSPDAAPA